MPLSFRAYVRAAAVPDSSAGDFISYARQDTRMPDAETWAVLRDYLKSRHAGRATIKAALDVWRGFEALAGKNYNA
jgi:hypothetical protein